MPYPLRAAAIAALAAAAFAQSPVDFHVTAQPTTVNLGPGINETAWTYNGTLPGPTIRVTEGQQLRVHFHNQLIEESTIHFHGQPSPMGMDGMSGMSRPSVAPGQEFLYEFDHLVPGTYWFHPHSDTRIGQLNLGLYGVLIVDPANPNNDPPYDVDKVIVLDDWMQPFGTGFAGHLINGKASTGQAPIMVNPGQRLRLRFINAAATSHYMVALDGHPMTVTHTDGNRIIPTTVYALPIGIGERYDVIVDCNNPGIWSLAASQLNFRNYTVVRGIVQYAGQSGPPPSPTLVPTNLSTGTPLSYSQLISWDPSPIQGAPNHTYPAALGMNGNMNFTINNEAFPNITPMPISQGDVVQLDMSNVTMGGSMYHPMHLHGHSFKLMNTLGGTSNAPIKDTILIRPVGQQDSSFSVQFYAYNPGRWMFHCHDMLHMANGMIAMFDYTGDSDMDGLMDMEDMDPGIAHPVLTIPDVATAFAPGASGLLSAQWRPGESVFFLAGFYEAAVPVLVPSLGRLYLTPGTAELLGFGLVQPNLLATQGYSIPANPALTGTRLCLQGVGTTNPGTMLVLTTYQAMTVR